MVFTSLFLCKLQESLLQLQSPFPIYSATDHTGNANRGLVIGKIYKRNNIISHKSLLFLACGKARLSSLLSFSHLFFLLLGSFCIVLVEGHDGVGNCYCCHANGKNAANAGSVSGSKPKY